MFYIRARNFTIAHFHQFFCTPSTAGPWLPMRNCELQFEPEIFSVSLMFFA